MKNQRSKTLILTFSGIAVFVIGAVLGSFLVLRSHTGEGKEFYIKNDDITSVQTSSESNLLSQLRRNKQYTGTPTELNLTEDALSFMLEQAQDKGILFDELGKNENVLDSLTSSFGNYKPILIPEIADNEIVISQSVDGDSYLYSMNDNFIRMRNAWREISGIAVSNVYSDNKTRELTRVASDMSSLTQELRSTAVREEHKEFHKNVIKLSVALRVGIEEYLLVYSDPMRSLLALNEMVNVEQFAAQVDKQFYDLVIHLP